MAGRLSKVTSRICRLLSPRSRKAEGDITPSPGPAPGGVVGSTSVWNRLWNFHSKGYGSISVDTCSYVLCW